MNKKILVVEDDALLGGAYKVKLTKSGFDIKLARDGEEALVELEKFQPDLMILDLIMPKLDGFSVLKQVRSNPSYSKLPIVVASNLGSKEEIDKAKDLGATDYVVKSDLSMSDLVEKIEKTLS